MGARLLQHALYIGQHFITVRKKDMSTEKFDLLTSRQSKFNAPALMLLQVKLYQDLIFRLNMRMR